MIVVNVTGGLQDQCGFSEKSILDNNGKHIGYRTTAYGRRLY